MDQKLLFLINREWTSPWLDRVMAFASSLDAWMPLIVLAAILAVWRGGFRVRVFVLTAGLIVAINDGVLAKNLKALWNRPRPNQVMSGVRMVDLAKVRPRLLAVAQPAVVKLSPEPKTGPLGGASLPSSHTINTMSVAIVAVCMFGARAAWAFAPALVVAYSRIYTGSHWPGHVVASLFLAVLFTLPMLCLLQWFWSKYGPRFFTIPAARNPRLFLP